MCLSARSREIVVYINIKWVCIVRIEEDSGNLKEVVTCFEECILQNGIVSAAISIGILSSSGCT